MDGSDRDALAETLAAFDRAAPPGTPLTTSEVAEVLSVPRRTAYDRLDCLVERGPLRTKKVGARGRVWWRPPAAAADDGPEDELERVFDRIDDAFYALDASWRFTYVNERAEALLGRPAEELLGERIWDVFPGSAGAELERRFREAMTTQRPVSFERASTQLGIWVEVRAYPSESGLSVYFRDVTDRKERERELQRGREQLAALNGINEVVLEIADAIVEQPTREGIEATVCERLAAAEPYLFAWIGDVDVEAQAVTVRTAAGVAAPVDDPSIPADPVAERGDGPVAQAIARREIRTTGDVRADPDPTSTSSAAVPIVHEGTTYGVLTVATDRPHAFSEPERGTLDRLGEIVGHALAAVERKRALTTDDVIELEFRLRDVFESSDDLPADARITFDRTVPLGGGEFVEYGTATDGGIQALSALVERVPHWTEMSVLDESFDECRFEIRLSEPPLLAAVAANGGAVERAVIEDGEFHMTVHLPQGADVRRLIETVRDTHPGFEAVARRQVSRPSAPATRVKRTWLDELTPRQRTALQTAYFAGFFEWPRDSSGEAVAESLDISPATFFQHVRLAERKLLDALFAELPVAEQEA
ncbi:bacterio-opsin activator domain-containing protein [Salinilacihabitans rarus]|uniref:bacterio-opsin activator domain-containing protein n=1 Tax=Salinilacihabitans rarus TaxID=2961596 RepID=UPI0020C84ED9|nr:bacterio-opsin activator domain-containing protein [Salinilacihabitans rarus]